MVKISLILLSQMQFNNKNKELIIDEAIAYVDSLDIDSRSDCNDYEKETSLNLTSFDLCHNVQGSDKKDRPNDDGTTFNNITITKNHSAVEDSQNAGPLYPNALFKVPSDPFDTVEKIFIMGGCQFPPWSGRPRKKSIQKNKFNYLAIHSSMVRRNNISNERQVCVQCGWLHMECCIHICQEAVWIRHS